MKKLIKKMGEKRFKIILSITVIVLFAIAMLFLSNRKEDKVLINGVDVNAPIQTSVGNVELTNEYKEGITKDEYKAISKIMEEQENKVKE